MPINPEALETEELETLLYWLPYAPLCPNVRIHCSNLMTCLEDNSRFLGRVNAALATHFPMPAKQTAEQIVRRVRAGKL